MTASKRWPSQVRQQVGAADLVRADLQSELLAEWRQIGRHYLGRTIGMRRKHREQSNRAAPRTRTR